MELLSCESVEKKRKRVFSTFRERFVTRLSRSRDAVAVRVRESKNEGYEDVHSEDDKDDDKWTLRDHSAG